jgi:hypothetical protein
VLILKVGTAGFEPTAYCTSSSPRPFLQFSHPCKLLKVVLQKQAPFINDGRLSRFWISPGGLFVAETNLFKWRHYQSEIILLCVRWYLRYVLSYRDLEATVLKVKQKVAWQADAKPHYPWPSQVRNLPITSISIQCWLDRLSPPFRRIAMARLSEIAAVPIRAKYGSGSQGQWAGRLLKLVIRKAVDGFQHVAPPPRSGGRGARPGTYGSALARARYVTY